MKFNHVTRIRVISICVCVFALLLIGKLYFLQVVQNDVYLVKADRQYSSTVGSVFDRGTIYFQNKDGSLVSGATLKLGYTIAINPQMLKEPEVVYTKLHALLPVDHDTFIAKASKKNDPYEEIARRVDLDVGQKIDDLNILGLNVYKERWRFYPGGDIASNALGILGYKGDEYAGRYGLERQYEKMLERKDDAYTNFFAEIFSDVRGTMSTTTASEGDIVTTIEPTVQTYLQQILATTTAKWSSDTTGGIIIDPNTGEIFAMGTYPTFDPNNPQKEKNVSIFSNPLVENVYEMGSIIKPLTLASGIDTGVVTATSTYNDTGFLIINNKKISNFDGKARGVVTMQDMLSQSLNVGAAHVEQLVGNKRFTEYMKNFGLNEKTGIDLPNEGRNLVENLDSPRDIEHATASFGQGIALTPITTVRALASIANGGTVIWPHLVKKINYKIGISKDVEIPQGRRVMKRTTSEEVSRMMMYSVDNVLMGGTLKLPRYTVAAKTGTAQIAKSGGGGYSDDQFLHSFVGFFPIYKPRFFIFLYTINPKGARYGSETLTAPFMETVKFLINYYDIPPDR